MARNEVGIVAADHFTVPWNASSRAVLVANADRPELRAVGVVTAIERSFEHLRRCVLPLRVERLYDALDCFMTEPTREHRGDRLVNACVVTDPLPQHEPG
jgi:hypothetical protein